MAKGGKKGGRKQFTNAETLEKESSGRGKRDDDSSGDDDDDDGAAKQTGNKMAQQASTVGMLPPNSDDEDEPKPKGKKVAAGDLPPSGSDDDDDDDSSSGDDGPSAPPPRQLTRKEREQLEAQRAKPDPEMVAADMEKLRLVREKRAAQAAARIASEGFDRFAPTPGVEPQPYPLAEGGKPKEGGKVAAEAPPAK